MEITLQYFDGCPNWEALERVEHWLVPVVFIGLGLFILIESGVIVRLFEVLA